MKRWCWALGLVAALGCRRGSAVRPQATGTARASAVQAAVRWSDPGEAEEIMEHSLRVSPYGDDAAGLRALFTDLAQAARQGPPARKEELLEALELDRDRVELACTFEGARQVSARLLAGEEERRERLGERLGALPQGAEVRVQTVAPGAALRTTVAFYRVEVGAGAGAVVVEPVAYLAGRWAVLGDPALVAAPTVPPTAPTGVAQGPGR